MIGKAVCRVHGGATPGGIAAGSWKNGKYSAYLPGYLGESYQTARSDPDLLALRDEIAVIDARLIDLLKKVDSGESGAIWGALQAAHGDLMMAKRKGDNPAAAAALNQIANLIEKGASDIEIWGDIGRQIDRAPDSGGVRTQAPG